MVTTMATARGVGAVGLANTGATKPVTGRPARWWRGGSLSTASARTPPPRSRVRVPRAKTLVVHAGRSESSERRSNSTALTTTAAKPRSVPPRSRSPAPSKPQAPKASIQDDVDLELENSDGEYSEYLKFLPLAAFGGFVGLGLAYKDPIYANLELFSLYLNGMGPTGFALFIVVYAALEILAIPAIPLTMTAGALFGVAGGTVAASIGATIAATGAFIIGRYFFQDKVQAWAADNPKLVAVDKAIAAEGFKMVALLRLSPLLPLSLSNYLYGVTSVELQPYVLGSWLGMLPGTFLYVQSGVVGRKMMEGVASEGGFESGTAPVVGALVVSILVARYVTKVATEAVAEITES